MINFVEEYFGNEPQNLTKENYLESRSSFTLNESPNMEHSSLRSFVLSSSLYKMDGMYIRGLYSFFSVKSICDMLSLPYPSYSNENLRMGEASAYMTKTTKSDLIIRGLNMYFGLSTENEQFKWHLIIVASNRFGEILNAARTYVYSNLSDTTGVYDFEDNFVHGLISGFQTDGFNQLITTPPASLKIPKKILHDVLFDHEFNSTESLDIDFIIKLEFATLFLSNGIKVNDQMYKEAKPWPPNCYNTPTTDKK